MRLSPPPRRRAHVLPQSGDSPREGSVPAETEERHEVPESPSGNSLSVRGGDGGQIFVFGRSRNEPMNGGVLKHADWNTEISAKVSVKTP